MRRTRRAEPFVLRGITLRVSSFPLAPRNMTARLRPLATVLLFLLTAAMRGDSDPVDAVMVARIREEGESFRRMLAEPAAREAFTAFMEKRKPDFSKV